MTIYHKNFLKEVIVRIDFLPALDRINKEDLPAELVKAILDSFPIAEPKTLLGREFELSLQPKQEVINAKSIQRKEFFYHGRDREKTLCISDNLMFIAYKKYDEFVALKEEFLKIVEILHKTLSPQINRFGLRYVNEIAIPGQDPFAWGDFLNPALLHLLPFVSKDKIARDFCTLALNYDSMKLLFRYGLHNPDFPAPIKKSNYVIDIDAFYEGVQNENDLKNNLQLAHDEIKRIFESCITEKLRGVMR